MVDRVENAWLSLSACGGMPSATTAELPTQSMIIRVDLRQRRGLRLVVLSRPSSLLKILFCAVLVD